jgi:hypothetical protein
MLARALSLLALVVALGAVPSAASAAGSIGGTVTSTNAAGIGNYTVELYTGVAGPAAASVCTAADGSYSFANLAPGTYYVHFAGRGAPCAATGYMPEWWNDRLTREFAEAIALADGEVKGGIDAELKTGLTIGGRVTDRDTGAGVGNVRAEVLDTNGDPAGSACTAADGTYTIEDLTPLPGTVRFVSDQSCGPVAAYPTQWYDDSDTQAGADPVSAPMAGVDGHLSLRSVRTLTVTPSGAGTITSIPAGISCPGTCAADFPKGTPVTLAASAASGWTFAGWGFPCGGTGACAINVDTDLFVGATFAATPGSGTPPPSGGTPPPPPGGGGASPPAPKCSLKPSAKTKKGAFSVKIACDASARLTLSGTVTYRRGRTLKLKSVTTIAAARTVTLKLPAAARTALRKRKTVSAALTLVAVNAGGQTRATAKVKRLR